jgi:hypothetical protein
MPIIPIPIPLPFPLINGKFYQHSSVELRFGASTYQGVKAINYKRTRTREKVKANSIDPIGKTPGENDYDADVELYLPHFNLWVLSTGIGYGDVDMLAIVSYTANGLPTITDTILGCTIDTTECASAAGPAALTRKVSLSPTKILFNGVDDVASFQLPSLF